MKNKITKKVITSVIRSENATEIFRLYHKLHGNVTHSNVYRFVLANAPTKRIADKAYDIVYASRMKCDHEVVDDKNKIHKIVQQLRYYMSDPKSNYTKKPFVGHTHLYWCNPAYGHSDYNKHIICEIKGNERLCELLIAMGTKY